MLSPKIAVGVAVAGIVIALVPVIIYLKAEIGGPLQHQFDTMIPLIPLHLLTALVGAAVTVAGLLMFIKTMRSQPIEYEPRILTHNKIPQPITYSMKPRRSTFKGKEQDIQLIERQLEEIISSPQSSKATVAEGYGESQNDKKIVEEPSVSRPEYEITVIVRGNDEICRNCGSSNPIGARVCSECGAKLFVSREGEPSCPVCGAPLSQAQKIGDNYVCQVCFSELRVENPFK